MEKAQIIPALFSKRFQYFFENKSAFPEGDFTHEPPEESDHYPKMDVRKPYLTQSMLSYGRKDGELWLKLRELNQEGDFIETLSWNETDDQAKEGEPPPAYLMRFWNFLRVNGSAEIWIQYWFSTIYESIESKSIVDTAEASKGMEVDLKTADLDDWIKYCITEIQSHMSLLDKNESKMIVD